MRLMQLPLIAALLASPGLSAAGTPPATTATDAAADAPQTKLPDKALLDQLIGTWDVDYELYGKDGKVRHVPGLVTYGWILDGGAIQETWADVDGQTVKPYGTTIEFRDEKQQLWTAIWVYPAASTPITIVTGGEVDGRVVLMGRDQDGAIQRWTTEDIQGDSFVARYESSKDGGKTWQALSVNRMHRHPG